VLLQLLARLSWQLLPPAALERLEELALLGPGALLDIYRCGWIASCCVLLSWVVLSPCIQSSSMIFGASQPLLLQISAGVIRLVGSSEAG
jgi:hypothetical protein